RTKTQPNTYACVQVGLSSGDRTIELNGTEPYGRPNFQLGSSGFFHTLDSSRNSSVCSRCCNLEMSPRTTLRRPR
uniref:Uncharacterized protein n=1 Tax=Oryza brachyantha TaxID=4533 RepID=J3LGW7_ORYBR